MTHKISVSTRARLLVATSASALLASLAFSAVASAQPQTVDTRWQPFLGCWVPDQTSAAIGVNAVSGSMVCVVPVQNSASVDIVSITNRMVTNRDRITVNGERTTKKTEDCPGWETANWSADGHRIYTRSEFACANNLIVKGSGVFALSSAGDWVQVQGSSVGSNGGARVVRFRPADVALAPGSMVYDSSVVVTVPAQLGFTQLAMRNAASTATDAAALLDMTKHVDQQVTQAWLSEFGMSGKLTANELVALSDAGMPTAVTDMMVAIANPERFQLRTRSPDAATATQMSAAQRAYNDRCNLDYRFDPAFDMSGSMMSSYDRNYCASRYGFGPFGYLDGMRYGWGNAYNQYGYNGYNGSNYYYGNQPIIIITRNPDGDQPLNRGRAVKGGGYSKGSGSSETSAPRQTSNPSSSGSSSGSSSAGSTSTGGEATSAASSGARTAKPRPPGGF